VEKRQKGFTLIELMIVMVIIMILAALAIPRFMRATARFKQEEAKQTLKQIYVMERAHFQEWDEYVCNGQTASANQSFPEIGIDISKDAKYQYKIKADSNHFTATATTNLDDDATIDTWTIDQTGTLQCTSNDAKY
jgi:prepilin-type N-terminal cleavage/methylation domain-containing protein